MSPADDADSPSEANPTPGVDDATIESPPVDSIPTDYPGELEPLDPGVSESGGELLAHFRLIEEVGRGGMGTVYRARDTLLDREVAVKVLADSLTSQPEFRSRFVKEARSIARLSHPNLPHIYFVGRAEERLFFAMEWIEGETLRSRLDRGSFDVQSALDVAQQAAAALSEAHRAGVVHRDIKPSNVMIGTDGVVKVLDFGIAKAKGSYHPVKLTGQFAGTPQYSSPEQAKGRPADVRSDIYALGLLLFEMISGRLPFQGDSVREVLKARLAGPVPELPAETNCEPEVRALVRHMLAQEPVDRFPNTEALLAAMEKVYPGPTTPARPAQRVMAFATDLLLIGIVGAMAVAGYLRLTGRFPTTALYDSVAGRITLGVLLAAWPVLYTALLSDRWGRTAGLRLDGLRVVSRSGDHPGRLRLIRRSLVIWGPVAVAIAMQSYWPPYQVKGPAVNTLLANLPWAFAMVWIAGLAFPPLFHKFSRGLADGLSGTEIVEAARPVGVAGTVSADRGIRSGKNLIKVLVWVAWILAATLLAIQVGRLGPVEANALTLVETVSHGDPGWERLAERFRVEYLGENERVINPEVLVFRRRLLHPVLWADTGDGQELLIQNSYFGTTTHERFQELVPVLDSSYVLRVWPTEEMVPENAEQARQWDGRRRQAYRGSRFHFMRALLHQRLVGEGFEVLNPAAFVGVYRHGDSFVLVARESLRVRYHGERGQKTAALILQDGFVGVTWFGAVNGSWAMEGSWGNDRFLAQSILQRYAHEQDEAWGSSTDEIDDVLELR